MKQGILLIAAGHPYYGKMAAALAASIRVTDEKMNIHLCFTDSALAYLSKDEMNLFSSSSPIDPTYYTHKGEKRFIKAKIYAYNLSPFDETIFLDTDIVWLRRPISNLFTELSGVPLTFSNHGVAGASLWVKDVEKLKEIYEVPNEKFIGIHSEFMYFKKNKAVYNFFRQAQNAYNKLKVPATLFAGAIPDELPFAIACMLTQMYPHEENFKPIFWQNADKRHLHLAEVAKEFYGLSLGGNRNPRMSIENYNLAVKAAYLKLGIQNPFNFKPKIVFLSERSKY